jgi:hypothetical protein
MKNKAKINLIIDAILMVLLMAMAGFGLLIKYVLVPGFKRNVLYGSDVELYFLGLDRHKWGSVHLWVSLVFIALIVLHIVLHWKQIVCLFKQMVKNHSARIIITVALVFLMFILGIAPLLVKPEIKPFVNAHQHQNFSKIEQHQFVKTDSLLLLPNKKITVDKTTIRHQKDEHESLADWAHTGAMTLNELAEKYKVSGADLAHALNIPDNMRTERIGRLKRMYGFDNDELKNEIEKLTNH